MKSGFLLSDDLIFISRILGTARSLGLEVKSARSAADLLSLAAADKPACVMIDLHNPGLDIALLVRTLKSGGQPFLVAYGSHVDAQTLKAAREAGCDVVWPRSKFVDDLGTEMPRWFSPSGPQTC